MPKYRVIPMSLRGFVVVIVRNDFGYHYGIMVRVYSSPLLTIVENVKNVLEANGIPSNITNQYLSAAVGEIPPIECWPQLWVAEDDADRASEIIKAQTSDKGGSWICPGCNEEIEPQFTECWNCGITRK